jgi:hypothetical protein
MACQSIILCRAGHAVYARHQQAQNVGQRKDVTRPTRLIADIHSNLPALTAVLEQMETVDMLVCAGDMVGYYNQPNEVCD